MGARYTSGDLEFDLEPFECPRPIQIVMTPRAAAVADGRTDVEFLAVLDNDTVRSIGGVTVVAQARR